MYFWCNRSHLLVIWWEVDQWPLSHSPEHLPFCLTYFRKSELLKGIWIGSNYIQGGKAAIYVGRVFEFMGKNNTKGKCKETLLTRPLSLADQQAGHYSSLPNDRDRILRWEWNRTVVWKSPRSGLIFKLIGKWYINTVLPRYNGTMGNHEIWHLYSRSRLEIPTWGNR